MVIKSVFALYGSTNYDKMQLSSIHNKTLLRNLKKKMLIFILKVLKENTSNFQNGDVTNWLKQMYDTGIFTFVTLYINAN